MLNRCILKLINSYDRRFTMLKLLRYQLLFKHSNIYKSILVQDGPLIDSLINDVPEQCLDNDVSPCLEVQYLSNCQKSQEEIRNQKIYNGRMIGNLHRLFVSIPTAHPQLNKFVNVHFLINTSSFYTTLTHRTLCAINHRPYSIEGKFPIQYKIGGRLVHIRLSNPNSQNSQPSHGFPSVNLLGMDFLTKYKKFMIDVDRENQRCQLILND